MTDTTTTFSGWAGAEISRLEAETEGLRAHNAALREALLLSVERLEAIDPKLNEDISAHARPLLVEEGEAAKEEPAYVEDDPHVLAELARCHGHEPGGGE